MQPGLHAFAQKSCFSGWGRVRFFCIAIEKKKDVTLRASCQTLSIFKIFPMLTLMPKM